MLYRDEEGYKLMPYIASYEQHDEEHEQHIIKKYDIEVYEEMGHIKNLEIRNAEYESGVKMRLEEVKNYPESEFQTVHRYVLDDTVLEGTSLAIEKQNEVLENSILELATLIGGGV